MSHRRARVGIAFLDLILALTALFGALTVVPSLPREWIAGSIFPDYTIPALGLGVLVGGSAAVASVAVLFKPMVGAAAAIVSALMIIGFEVVEIASVGFAPLTHGAANPQSWLQVVYVALGLVLAALGAGLWRALGGFVPLVHEPARRSRAASS
jgi:hypothetical protein